MSESILESKQLVQRFRAALYDLDADRLQAQLDRLFSRESDIRLVHPLGDVTGPEALFKRAYAPLIDAMPDLERRDYVMAGGDYLGENWVGCGGYYMGVFERPWLDIPPTRHLVTMRFIEFFRVERGHIIEAKLMWDVPSVMMQADAWPMAPSLGVEINVPGPATQDGILDDVSPPGSTQASMDLVDGMLDGLARYAEGGAEAMALERFWHPNMNWYGPAGIGSNRRVSGFRNWHQIPFLSAMPDRSADKDGKGCDCYFADGDYVLYCGWPGMRATVSGDGWMGIAPAGQELKFASLDIWRCEKGLIRENWVLIDILDIWRQLGVDVLSRMRECTFSRQGVAFKP